MTKNSILRTIKHTNHIINSCARRTFYSINNVSNNVLNSKNNNSNLIGNSFHNKYNNNNCVLRNNSHSRRYFSDDSKDKDGSTKEEASSSSGAGSTDTDDIMTPMDPDAASDKVKALVEEVLSLNLLEMNQLTALMQRKMGVTDAMLMGGGGGGGGGSGQAAGDNTASEPVEEKTAFDLKLTSFDAKSKIKIIKEVRTITGLGLKEAKELVEGTPATVKQGLSKEEAEEFKKKLVELGAEVEVA